MDLLRTTLFAIGATVTVALSSCGDPGNEDTAADGAAETATPAGEAEPAGAQADAGATPTDETAAAAAPGDAAGAADGDACGASEVAPFVSRKATADVKASVAAEVGHSRIRWIGPDTVVTMDFNPERLNVMLDADEIITGARCG